jgi:hypothetical protein
MIKIVSFPEYKDASNNKPISIIMYINGIMDKNLMIISIDV